MTKIFKAAMAALKTLPVEERERISAEIIERLEDMHQWEELVNSHRSYAWLKSHADRALREYDRIAQKLSATMVNVPFDNLLREGSYWKSMEKLPDDICQLAEKSYALWRDNPKDSKLRFKKIHPSQPIFSFRVAPTYRTIGVESNDDRLIWFWVGSFDAFTKAVAEK